MREKQKKTFWSAVYSSNIFIAILLVVLILSILKVGKELARRHQINKEISHLNQQLAEAELNRDKLEDLISYLQSDQYIEEQARTQLNLSKPGEKRIDLSEQAKTLDQLGDASSDLSNWQKWFAYFFK
ncbi:septum formation initiator family protein [Candidatus Nomurabacteria bacterium]|nr:septum formation initiator family protein [Candidatus Nomurabacteria bacterium]